jgi:hypothetical protein
MELPWSTMAKPKDPIFLFGRLLSEVIGVDEQAPDRGIR